MIELQAILKEWLAGLVELLPVGFAFGAGMISTVNPCGFAMMPAYLSLYLGAREGEFYQRSVILRALRALLVSAMVSIGFVLLFGALGAPLAASGRLLLRIMPWIALAIGLALTLLAIWMLMGRTIPTGMIASLASRIGDPRNTSLTGFLVFGVAFGAASLSCTLPIFLGVVGSAVASGGFVAGMTQFISYSLGMGLVVLVVTMVLALFKEGLNMKRLRGYMRHMHTVTALFLLLAGGYIIYYWLFKGGLINQII